MIASSTWSTFMPGLRRDADDAARDRRRAGRRPRRDAPSGSACGRSILFTTGTISSPFSIARYAFASVCASIPCAASTTSSAPSHAWSERETSYVKSTWPGVSIRLSSWPFHETRTACALIVIPRSRSRSIESSSWARMSRAETASVISRMRSASVDLPWSMCAMIEKLRILLWSMGSAAMVLVAPVFAGIPPAQARRRREPQREQRVELSDLQQPAAEE